MRRSWFKKALVSISVSFLGSLGVTALGYASLGRVEFQSHSQLAARIKNWGLINEQTDSHIHALDAWKLEKGSRSVVVAVIDTGVDVRHPDLKKNIWTDPNSLDSETHGWDFVENRSNPQDQHGHGTHVAGIIGAIANPSTGVSGVAQNVSIMPVKYYSDGNTGAINLRNTVQAIHYAIDHGAKIINYSGGGPEFSEEEYLAIKKAEAAGILFVAAAGNEHQDTDLAGNYYYPSAYRLSNIVSVAATDIRNNLLRTSNWGKTRVDVTAPGENIFSTLPGGRYGYMSGTSQATAFVTGLAALLLSKDPTLKPHEIKRIILSSVDPIPGLKSKVVSGGRVNAYSALVALESFTGGKISLRETPPSAYAQNPISKRSPILQLLTSPQAE